MEAASANLTPVVMELGGKDPFIVCDDADYDQALSTGLRGAFQSCGQNCTGAERFFIHSKHYERWLADAGKVARGMRQGSPLGGGTVDAGAMCLPGLAQKIQGLVDDAVAKGARVVAGGVLPQGTTGMFYPPTVITNVDRSMMIWHEETFGPVMIVVSWEDDDEVVQLANDCPFGLGSSVFSNSKRRAVAIAERLEVGMSAINDFATTYMCQSLPFGGVKLSGFDRFAGVEGLRGMCIPKAVCEDKYPLMKTTIPPPLRYPVADNAFHFVEALVRMFYGLNMLQQAQGLFSLAGVFLLPKPKAAKKHE